MNEDDPNIDRIKRDIESLTENTNEILLAIEARRGKLHATICLALFAATQEFFVLHISSKDEYCKTIAKSGTTHLSRAIAYLNASKEFAGIYDDLTILIDRANTDWHSKGHM